MKSRTIVTIVAAALLGVGLLPTASVLAKDVPAGIEVIDVVAKRPTLPSGVEVITVVAKRPAPTMASACVDEARAHAAALDTSDRDSLRNAFRQCMEQGVAASEVRI